MGKRIRVLDETSINQIAAGEVVESPASVVKELVENALDAGAREIEIEIKGGGHLSIEIRDDGTGMGQDDAILSLERHATSKIATFNDLARLSTMGFRGEALASISSVSKVEIETKEAEGEGTKVICHGGKLVKLSKWPRERGTTIRVSSLFYNVPARRKFQKSSNQAASDIVKIVTKLALAHKETAFTLISQEKKILKTSGDPTLRISEVLGEEFLRGMREVSLEKDGYTIQGFVGSPLHVKTNRTGQYLFINKRGVVSNFLENAVRAAYGTRIGSKDHPMFLLSISMPSEEIDVNVHPQKIHVRFHQEAKIFQFVKNAVESSFEAPLEEYALPKEVKTFTFREEIKTYSRPKSVAPPPRMERPPPPAFSPEELSVVLIFGEVAILHASGDLPLFGIHGGEEKLLLLDIKRARQKIQYEELLATFAKEKKFEVQKLLFPEQFVVSSEQEALILKHREELKKMGLEPRPFGKGVFIIEEIPPLYQSEKIEETIHCIVDQLERGESPETLAESLLRFTRGGAFRKEEVKSLLAQLMRSKDPLFTPKGKKILLALSQEEVEELFTRREYA